MFTGSLDISPFSAAGVNLPAGGGLFIKSYVVVVKCVDTTPMVYKAYQMG
jgi:hypothetical protein